MKYLRKSLAVLLIVSLLCTLLVPGVSAASIITGTKPADGTTYSQPFASGTGGSANFRIPALVTMNDGTLVAAADARWDTSADGGGLDTIVSRSADGGATWNYTFANYLGDNGNTHNTSSTAFIDPALATDGETVYMLVDLFAYGIALNGANQQPSTDSGFDSNGRLILTNGNSYYLENGLIYSASGEVVSGYEVDDYFNITGTDGTDTNLFCADSPFKVQRTGFLYLTKSDDHGATWSAPKLLPMKRSGEQAYLAGPAGGIVTSTGRIIFPCYSYNNADGNTSVIYSDDGGETWTRGSDMNVQTSEASIAEADGRLYMFTRHGGYFVSLDNGTTWSTQQAVNGISYTTSCELNVMTYSKKINGKTALILSAPTSARTNGKLFVGLIQDDGSISWEYTYSVNNSTYQYSAVTELPSGNIGLLYENGSASIYYTEIPIGDVIPGAVIGEPEIVNDEVYGISAAGYGLTSVTATAVESVGGLEDCDFVAYDISINGGEYHDSAEVTIPLPEAMWGYTQSELTGFVCDENGSMEQRVSGTLDSTAHTFTFMTPHFTVVGAASLSTEDEVDVSLYAGQTAQYELAGEQTQLTNPDNSIASVVVSTVSGEDISLEEITGTDQLVSGESYIFSNTRSNHVLLTTTTSGTAWKTTALNQGTSPAVDSTAWKISTTNTNGTYLVQTDAGQYLTIGANSSDVQNNSTNILLSHSNSGWSIGLSADNTTYYLNDLGGEGNLAGGYNVQNDAGAYWKIWKVQHTAADPTTSVTIKGIAEGDTSSIIGSTTYRIHVAAIPEGGIPVDSENTPFLCDPNRTGAGSALTRLTLSVGYSYNIDLRADIDADAEIQWWVDDEEIASVDQNGVVTGNDIHADTAENYTSETTLHCSINGTVYSMPLKIGRYAASSDVKFGDFHISEITDTDTWFTMNLSGRNGYMVKAVEGEAIYAAFDKTSAACINFYSKPYDGYALTFMSATNSAGQYFYLANKSDPTDTAFYTGQNADGTSVNAAGYNERSMFSAEAVRADIQAALDKGCDGAMGFSRGASDANNATCDISIRSQRLPTVTKEIVSITHDNTVQPYVNGMGANIGDVINYKITVTQYATTEAFTYTDATLSDQIDARGYDDNHNLLNISSLNDFSLTNGTLANDSSREFSVAYTVAEKDWNTLITNSANLDYNYTTQYGAGTLDSQAVADARISVPYFTPADLVLDSGLPVEVDYASKAAQDVGLYSGAIKFPVVDAQAEHGSVTLFNSTIAEGDSSTAASDVTGTLLRYTPEKTFTGVDTITLTNAADATVSFKVYPATSVYYEENAATYTGTWAETVESNEYIRTQNPQIAGNSSDEYGYNSAYLQDAGASNGTAAVSGTDGKGDSAVFEFTGTGVELYTNNTVDSGMVFVGIKNSEGKTAASYIVYTAMLDGDSNATANQAGDAYNVPIVSIRDLPHDNYTMQIVHVQSYDSESEQMVTRPVSIDGFRVFGTMETEPAFYATDLEDNPSYTEVRDFLLTGLKVDATDVTSKQVYDKIDGNVPNGTISAGAIVLSAGQETPDSETLTDLLVNGPKNEVYLQEGQSLTFNVKTAREVQLGMKALNGTVKATINDESKTISTSVDMFYTVAAKGTAAGENGKTITITNTEGGTLSITLLKVCDDPNAMIMPVETIDFTQALKDLGIAKAPEKTDEPEKPEVVNPFEDVSACSFYYKPVLWAVEKGITSGVDATHFAPKSECTRAQVVTFLWRAAGKPEPVSNDNPFTDVPGNKYYTKAVLWAVENGITAGLTATTFGPNEPCTRAQVVTFLWRAAGKPEPVSSDNPFADVPANKYYAKAVLWAAENGITSGTTETTFTPANPCTRGQIVTFLYRSAN